MVIMTEYHFRLLLDVTHELTDPDLNALYARTQLDVTFSSDDDGWSAEYDRSAPSLAAAVAQATQELESAGVGVTVRQVLTDQD